MKIEYLAPKLAKNADPRYTAGVVKHTRFTAPPLKRDMSKAKTARYITNLTNYDGLQYVKQGDDKNKK